MLHDVASGRYVGKEAQKLASRGTGEEWQRYCQRHVGFRWRMMLPVEDMSVKKHKNLLLEELEKSDSEGLIRAKLAGSCLTAAIYFIVYFSQSMHPRTEIDMAVFEVPL